MVYHIETSREKDGSWVAKVPALPGLQVYGYSEGETLSIAGRLAALLTPTGNETRSRILGFYPGRIPAAAQVVAQPA